MFLFAESGIPFTSTSKNPRAYPAFTPKGEPIYIKSIPLHDSRSHELTIWRHLTEEHRIADHRNHCIPARDVLFYSPDYSSEGFTPEPGDRRVLVVMDHCEPLMRDDWTKTAGRIDVNSRRVGPRYPRCCDEANLLDFARQVIEVSAVEASAKLVANVVF